MKRKEKRERVAFVIHEKVGVVAATARGRLEVRRVAWGGAEAKTDLRRWRDKRDGGEMPLAGLVLSAEEWAALRAFCAGYDAGAVRKEARRKGGGENPQEGGAA
jgi:hypothetical protein